MQNALFFQPIDFVSIKKTAELLSEHQLTDSPVLIFHLKGKGRIDIGTDSFPLQKETLYICPSEETFSIEPAPSSSIHLYIVRLRAFSYSKDDRAMLPRIGEDIFHGLQQMNIQTVENLTSRLQSLAENAQSSDTLMKMKYTADFQQLMYDLYSANVCHQNNTKTAIEQTKQFIKAQSDTKITLTQLAQMAGISAKHYSETFKKLYGKSVTEYITDIRITNAKKLMAKANCKLREIAHQTGYQDEFYFSRIFKKYTGSSPTSYMKKRRTKMAAYGKEMIGHLIPLHHIPYAAALHPKWTAYYYKQFAPDIPIHLSAYRSNANWEENLQMLSQTAPDVILSMDSVSKEEKNRLHKITDVFYLPSQENWRTQFLLTAAYLNEEKEAQHWLEMYQNLVHSAKESLVNLQKHRFLFIRLYKEDFYLAHNKSIQDVFFGDLAFHSAKPEHIAADQKISFNMLTNCQADCLMLFICKEPETLDYFQRIQQTAEWQNLRAVRDKRVFPVSSDPWGEYSPSGHQRIIQQTISIFSEDRPW
ncbi:AraC family transcriptional regulator [Bacillus sp. ISL-26]|uniref:bacillibactin transport transcriptional regulator Btr n=1 Tax=Bacillus sp. ISL-26 TaxID=2819119 RepID=UPI001BE5B8ED|nr:helix-turn-helix domain-containing protein [Bacillus sp. ISL-26]MBT2636281.1 AraC family transcriptional regulator [Bacillus sp. ISL-26]